MVAQSRILHGSKIVLDPFRGGVDLSVDISRGGSNEMRSVMVAVTRVTYLECW